MENSDEIYEKVMKDVSDVFSVPLWMLKGEPRPEGK